MQRGDKYKNQMVKSSNYYAYLLYMNPCYSDHLTGGKLQGTAGADRVVILSNLIVFRSIWIEIIFSVEFDNRTYLALKSYCSFCR